MNHWPDSSCGVTALLGDFSDFSVVVGSSFVFRYGCYVMPFTVSSLRVKSGRLTLFLGSDPLVRVLLPGFVCFSILVVRVI